MADPIDDHEDTFERLNDDDVLGAVRRMMQIVAGVKEAHALGYGPAAPEGSEPPEVARGIADAFVSSVPRPVAVARAEWAQGIARYMTARGSPPGIVAEWVFFTEAMARLGSSYLAAVPPAAEAAEDPAVGEIIPLYTIGFRSIGPTVAAELVADVGRSAERIEKVLSSARRDNPLSASEIVLLRGLVDGWAVSDLAAELGFAERSVYRILRNVWIRIGAASRSEGIAIATAQGWLGPEREDDDE